MVGIAADIPEAGKCRKYGQKRWWDAAGRQGSASKVHKTDGWKLGASSPKGEGAVSNSRMGM